MVIGVATDTIDKHDWRFNFYPIKANRENIEQFENRLSFCDGFIFFYKKKKNKFNAFFPAAN